MKRVYEERCAEAVYRDQDKASAMTSVFTFSQYCQALLGLTLWPAQGLCNDFGKEANFPVWIGRSCDIPCYFGHRAAQDPTVCICSAGYWGVSCRQTCPGGASDPCSGFGPCDTFTGVCMCPVNRNGSAECSVCSQGWEGDSCHIAVGSANGTYRIAKLTDTGAVNSFDGMNFVVTQTGEYHLLNIPPNLIIQAKLIRCYVNFSCVSFLGFRIGTAEDGYAMVTIQGPFIPNGRPLVYINTKLHPLDEKVNFNYFEVKRLSQTEIGLDIHDGINVVVRARDQYLHFTVTLPSTLVAYTSGVLSGEGSSDAALNLKYVRTYTPNYPAMNLCASSGKVLHSGGPGKTLPLVLNTTEHAPPQTPGSLQEFISQWLVRPCDSIISYPSKEYRMQQQGGYSLKFTNTSIFSTFESNMVIGPNVTFELMVKGLEGTDIDGVLFSLAGEELFLVAVINGLLVITHQNISFHTDLSFQPRAWNKFVLTYEGKSGDTNVYVIHDNLHIFRRTTTMPKNLFVKPASLLIGQCQPPSNGAVHTPLRSLVGILDDFHIWRTLVESTLIHDLSSINLQRAAPLLNGGWAFDEGQGHKARDSVYGHAFLLPERPWQTPEWIPSDLLGTHKSSLQPLHYHFRKYELQQAAENKCSLLLSVFDLKSCENLTVSVRQFYYLTCLQKVSFKESMDAYFEVLHDLSDLCQVHHDIPTWPAANTCELPKVKLRRGTQCKDKCTFGRWTNASGCDCFEGYYGDICNQVCPGGVDNTCNSHGWCNTTGSCECDYNWRGRGSEGVKSGDCGACSHGWTSQNCSILLSKPIRTSTSFMAYISASGIYGTFDGATLSLPSIGPIINLLSSSHIQIQAHRATCLYGSCIQALYMTLGHDMRIQISASTSKDTPMSIYLNDTILTTNSTTSPETLSTKVNLTWISLTSVEISYGFSTNSLKILIQSVKQFLDTLIESPRKMCEDAQGLLGSCDGDWTNDLGGDPTNVTAEDIRATLDSLYSVPPNQSLINVHLPMISSDSLAGYALSFNNTAARSIPLVYSLGKDFTDQEDVTVSFMAKVTQDGVIFSYGRNATFSILTKNSNIQLVISNTIIRTTAKCVVGEWSQIIVACERRKNILHFYHWGIGKRVTYQRFTADCNYLLSGGGIVTLGEWQPTPDGRTHSFGSPFVGVIDEVSIWKLRLPHALIYQMCHLNIQPEAFKNSLVTLYKLNEGFGFITRDNVMENSLLLPNGPWPSPQWISSDADLQDLRTVTDEAIRNTERNTTLEKLAKTFCASYYHSVEVTSECSKVDIKIKDLFHFECVKSISVSGEVENGYASMVMFSQLCASTRDLNKTAISKSYLCSFTQVKPDWLKELCAECGMGLADATGGCVCEKGFWGVSCDQVCPGGGVAPCTNHGDCGIDGKCHCHGHWDGHQCNLCSPGWIGVDCVILPTGYIPSSNMSLRRVAQLDSYGQILTFDGVVFDITSTKTHTLFGNQEYHIYAGLSHCTTGGQGSNLCLTSIVLVHHNLKVFIRAENVHKDRIVVTLQTGDVTVYTSALIGGRINVERTSQHSFTLNIVNMSLTMEVIVNENSLAVTILCSEDLILGSFGLLSSCNTTQAISTAQCTSNPTVACGDVPADCHQELSQKTLLHFLHKHEIADTEYDKLRDLSPAATNAGLCVLLRNVGLSSSPLTNLPPHQFTIDLQVNVVAFGGVIIAYHYQDDWPLCILSSKAGIVIQHGVYVYRTNLTLELDQWVQVSVVWDGATKLLECYVVDKQGGVKVHTLQLKRNPFSPGGVLSLGKAPPGVKAPVNAGTFHGFIDELHVWNRPHNPTLIKFTWRLEVTRTTPNLLLWWDFHDGRGSSITERISKHHLRAIDPFSPPKWQPSNLQLVVKDKMAPPVRSYNTSQELEFKKVCSEMVGNKHLQERCSLGPAITNAFLTQCMQTVSNRQDASASIIPLLQLSSLCVNVMNLTDNPVSSLCGHINNGLIREWFGTNCTQSKCVFGTFTNSTCNCYDGYFGAECQLSCPVGKHGPCNGQGVCTEGLCTCQSRWLSEGNSTVDYGCTQCTLGWHGRDCNIAGNQDNATLRYSYGIAVITNIYVTVFSGASYEMTWPGSYQLLSYQDLSIQALFYPCHQFSNCRTLQEVSIRKANIIISIRLELSNLKISIKRGHRWSEQFFSRTDIVKLMPDFWLTWKAEDAVRVSYGGDVELVVAVFEDEMFLGVKAAVRLRDRLSGLLGTFRESWQEDLIAASGSSNSTSEFIEDVFSREYLGTKLRELYSLHTKYSHLRDVNANRSLSASGYMMRFNNCSVRFANINVVLKDEFTATFWVKLYADSFQFNEIFIFKTQQGSLNLIVQDGKLGLNYHDGYYFTDIHIHHDTWMYIGLSWRRRDGHLSCYVFTDRGVQMHSFSGVFQGTSINLLSLVFASSETTMDVDLFRLWDFARMREDIQEDMKHYATPAVSKGAVLLVAFDEGFGIHPILTYSSPEREPCNGTMSFTVNPPQWLPSDIPIIVIPEPLPIPLHPDWNATEVCTAAFENAIFHVVCDLGSIRVFYTEACLREVTQRNDPDVVRLLLTTLVWYCTEVEEVDECTFHGYLDYCIKDTPIEIWVIVIIVICSIVVTTCCFCCCGAICLWNRERKKKKKKQEIVYPKDIPHPEMLSATVQYPSPYEHGALYGDETCDDDDDKQGLFYSVSSFKYHNENVQNQNALNPEGSGSSNKVFLTEETLQSPTNGLPSETIERDPHQDTNANKSTFTFAEDESPANPKESSGGVLEDRTKEKGNDESDSKTSSARVDHPVFSSFFKKGRVAPLSTPPIANSEKYDAKSLSPESPVDTLIPMKPLSSRHSAWSTTCGPNSATSDARPVVKNAFEKHTHE